jgi:hypothetical protein
MKKLKIGLEMVANVMEDVAQVAKGVGLTRREII